MKSPACFSDSRHFSVVRQFPKTNPAQTEHSHISVRAAAAPTSSDGSGLELGLSFGFYD